MEKSSPEAPFRTKAPDVNLEGLFDGKPSMVFGFNGVLKPALCPEQEL
jgi:hypothetical protein